jgi:hypothetical protein
MTKAQRLIDKLRHPENWRGGPAHQAQQIDRNYGYDRMEPDLAFVYFTDGSVAGVRPKSRQAWIPSMQETLGPDPLGDWHGRNV